jgi:hypothetical protein
MGMGSSARGDRLTEWVSLKADKMSALRKNLRCAVGPRNGLVAQTERSAAVAKPSRSLFERRVVSSFSNAPCDAERLWLRTAVFPMSWATRPNRGIFLGKGRSGR